MDLHLAKITYTVARNESDYNAPVSRPCDELYLEKQNSILNNTLYVWKLGYAQQVHAGFELENSKTTLWARFEVDWYESHDDLFTTSIISP